MKAQAKIAACPGSNARHLGSGPNSALPLTRDHPMQTQSRSSRAQPPRPSVSGVHAAPMKTAKKKTPPPVLASEVLREDLAPLEPGRRASRWWDGAIAVLFLALGVCLRFGFGVSSRSPRAGAICLAA